MSTKTIWRLQSDKKCVFWVCELTLMRKINQSVSTSEKWAMWALNFSFFLLCGQVPISPLCNCSNKCTCLNLFHLTVHTKYRNRFYAQTHRGFVVVPSSCWSFTGCWLSHGLCSLCCSSPGCPPSKTNCVYPFIHQHTPPTSGVYSLLRWAC